MKKENRLYPDPNASAKRKAENGYGLQYARAMYDDQKAHASTVFSYRNVRYRELQKYRQGLQSADKYKETFNCLKGIFGPDHSLSNLDFSIISPIPSMIDTVKGAIMDRGFDISCRAVSPEADNEKLQYKMRTQATMKLIKRGLIPNLRGIVGAPPIDTSGLPETQEDLEAKMEFDFKTPYEIMAEESIELIFSLEDYLETMDKVIDDLATFKIGGTRTFIDSRGRIKIEPVETKRLITDYTHDPKFRNARHYGVVIDRTVSQLREMCGGELTEANLEDIANKYDNWGGNGSAFTGDYGYDSYNEQGQRYDSYKVKIMHFQFFTNNKIAHKKRKTKGGNNRSVRVDDTYKVPENSPYQRNDIDHRVCYEGYWVVDTPYIFGYKMCNNMAVEPGSLLDASGAYTLYAPGLKEGTNKSVVEELRPLADDFMEFRLKLMSEIAQAAPPGESINWQALMNVPKGKGSVWQPLDLLEIRRHLGMLLHGPVRDNGAHTGPPVQPLPSNFPEVEKYFMLEQKTIERMREVSGITQAFASEAPERQSVVATRMSVNSASRAISPIIRGVVYITQGTAEKVLSLMQLLSRDGEIVKYTHGLGTQNVRMFKITDDIDSHQFGIFMEMRPDEIEKAKMEEQIQTALNQRQTNGQGGINMADAMFIRRISNVKRAEQELARRIKQNQERDAKEKQEAIRLQGEENQKLEQAKLQAEVQKQQLLSDIKTKEERLKHELEMERIAKQFEYDRILKSMDNDNQYVLAESKHNQDDQKIQADLIKSREANDSKEKIAKMQAERAMQQASKVSGNSESKK